MDLPIEHITIEGDAPRTRNGNVKVRMIALKHLESGESVEDVAAHYGITVADVYAALAYYFDHKPYFDERDRENERLLREHGRSMSDILAAARKRMKE